MGIHTAGGWREGVEGSERMGRSYEEGKDMKREKRNQLGERKGVSV